MKSALHFFIFIFFASQPLFAAQAPSDLPWQLRKDREGISVHTRKVKGSPILEFKSKTVVDAPLDSVVAFFENEINLTHWYYQCVRAELIEDEGPQQKICYFVVHLPWPVVDRDSVYRCHKSKDAGGKVVNYSFEALPDRLPRQKGKVRVLYIKTLWRFTALSDGRTEIYFQQHSNPGGSIPAMLVNQLAMDIPYNSLKNFRRLVEKK